VVGGLRGVGGGEVEGGGEGGFEELLEEVVGEDDHAEGGEGDMEGVGGVKGEVCGSVFAGRGVGGEVRGELGCRGWWWWWGVGAEVEEVFFFVVGRVAHGEVVHVCCYLGIMGLRRV